jgi:phosphate transport system permease protein
MSASGSMSAPASRPRSTSLRRRARPWERVQETLIQAVAFVAIALVLLIFVFVGKEALPALPHLGDLFLPTSDGAFVWQPSGEHPEWNVVPLIAGTLKVTAIALVVAVPLSVLAAVYVSEFANRRAREVLKPAIELLAGVPSIVVGFFALEVLATCVQRVFGTSHRLNALVAGLALAFAVCPIVFSLAEDAMRAVPASYRAAACSLGATRGQIVRAVVLPAAMPGIAAATVLGFGRAIGETMIVLLASGNAPLLEWSAGRSTRTLTATIASELGELVFGSAHYHVLFALGAFLFLSTLGVNLLGAALVARMRAAHEGDA